MNISKNGIDLIKEFEGLRLNAYLDTVGKPTIGYGTTLYPNNVAVKMGDKITSIQAEEYLKYHLDNRVLPALNKLITIPLSQNNVDALCSLIYNIGMGNFAKYSVSKLIQQKSKPEEIESAWLSICKERKNGQLVINSGLLRRRKAEFALFNKK